MKLWKRLITLTLCVIMLFSVVACGGSGKSTTSNSSVPADRQYSFWFRTGNEQYTDFNENPAVEYLQTLPYGTDENGNEKFIKLSFTIPPTGSEVNNFNTLLATGEYLDVMDLSAYTGRAVDLYDQGVAMDITDYVKNYMPHYMAFLDANPQFKATATNVINGEKRFISIYTYADAVPEMWGGFLYRRDWIVKYGTNPVDGSSFIGAYTTINADGTPDPDSWEDNVVFPSGGSDPVYISDWEWMLGIFKTAIENLGITDGYPLSLYYPGYIETGDLVCAFGGGNPTWYKNPDNQIVFGGTSDGFRSYLQAMNTWYKNGWIDKAFPEHTSDMFYQIDNAKVYSGKVGLWYGQIAAMGGRLAAAGNPNLDGYVAFVAAQPINDIYGSDAQKNKTPFAMYQNSQEQMAYIVTTAAKDKDLITLFTFLDYMYSPEGAAIRSFGLSKEQYDITHNAFMTKNGFTNGAYTLVVDPDGVTRYRINQDVVNSGLELAVKAARLPGLKLETLRSKSDYSAGYARSMDRLIQYKNTGWLSGSFTGQLSVDDSKTYSKINTNVTEFMTKNVPAFIQGLKDPNSEDDWNAFVNALNKYGPDKVTSIFQALADSMYAK
jgi:hypothetical protein